jgi:hypothetical protein
MPLLRGTALAAVAACASGCAAPPEWTPGPAAPDGFVLDIAVIDRSESAAPRGIVTRAVLLSDGWLHFEERRGTGTPWPAAGSDGSALIDWFPAPARWLAPDQVQSVWELCRAQGLGDPSRARPAGRFELPVPAPGAAAHLVVIGSADRWWEPAPDAAPDGDPPAAGRALVGRLRELSLVAPSAGAGAVAPQRYDFGPDPYARYREGRER